MRFYREMFEPGSRKYCSPYCKFFRCQRKALVIKGNRRYCALTGEECDPIHCQFASCAINKLVLPEGTCGLWLEKQRKRRRRIEISDIEDMDYKIKGRKDLFL